MTSWESNATNGQQCDGKEPESKHLWLLSAGRKSVAHLVAQNAHHQADTDIPNRHAALNPRALAVQADVSDRFL